MAGDSRLGPWLLDLPPSPTSLQLPPLSPTMGEQDQDKSSGSMWGMMAAGATATQPDHQLHQAGDLQFSSSTPCLPVVETSQILQSQHALPGTTTYRQSATGSAVSSDFSYDHLEQKSKRIGQAINKKLSPSMPACGAPAAHKPTSSTGKPTVKTMQSKGKTSGKKPKAPVNPPRVSTRCEVCLKLKKGRCGTETAPMKCLKRRTVGLPYLDEVTGTVIVDPAHQQQKEPTVAATDSQDQGIQGGMWQGLFDEPDMMMPDMLQGTTATVQQQQADSDHMQSALGGSKLDMPDGADQPLTINAPMWYDLLHITDSMKLSGNSQDSVLPGQSDQAAQQQAQVQIPGPHPQLPQQPSVDVNQMPTALQPICEQSTYSQDQPLQPSAQQHTHVQQPALLDKRQQSSQRGQSSLQNAIQAHRQLYMSQASSTSHATPTPDLQHDQQVASRLVQRHGVQGKVESADLQSGLQSAIQSEKNHLGWKCTTQAMESGQWQMQTTHHQNSTEATSLQQLALPKLSQPPLVKQLLSCAHSSEQQACDTSDELESRMQELHSQHARFVQQLPNDALFSPQLFPAPSYQQQLAGSQAVWQPSMQLQTSAEEQHTAIRYPGRATASTAWPGMVPAAGAERQPPPVTSYSVAANATTEYMPPQAGLAQQQSLHAVDTAVSDSNAWCQVKLQTADHKGNTKLAETHADSKTSLWEPLSMDAMWNMQSNFTEPSDPQPHLRHQAVSLTNEVTMQPDSNTPAEACSSLQSAGLVDDVDLVCQEELVDAEPDQQHDTTDTAGACLNHTDSGQPQYNSAYVQQHVARNDSFSSQADSCQQHAAGVCQMQASISNSIRTHPMQTSTTACYWNADVHNQASSCTAAYHARHHAAPVQVDANGQTQQAHGPQQPHGQQQPPSSAPFDLEATLKILLGDSSNHQQGQFSSNGVPAPQLKHNNACMPTQVQDGSWHAQHVHGDMQQHTSDAHQEQKEQFIQKCLAAISGVDDPADEPFWQALLHGQDGVLQSTSLQLQQLGMANHAALPEGAQQQSSLSTSTWQHPGTMLNYPQYVGTGQQLPTQELLYATGQLPCSLEDAQNPFSQTAAMSSCELGLQQLPCTTAHMSASAHLPVPELGADQLLGHQLQHPGLMVQQGLRQHSDTTHTGAAVWANLLSTTSDTQVIAGWNDPLTGLAAGHPSQPLPLTTPAGITAANIQAPVAVANHQPMSALSSHQPGPAPALSHPLPASSAFLTSMPSWGLHH